MERSFQVIYSWELREAHKQEIKNHFESFNPWFKWAIKFLEDITFQDYQEALEEAEYTRLFLKKFLERLTLLFHQVQLVRLLRNSWKSQNIVLIIFGH